MEKMSENTIYFFGAGASKAPLQNKLFKVYFSLIESNEIKEMNGELYDFIETNEYKEMNNRLYKFFKDFFAIDIEKSNLEKINFPTFEEVLGILELALMREESFKNYGLSHNNPKIQKIKQDLIFLIAIVIDAELKRKNRRINNSRSNKNLENDTNFHKILVDKLIEEDKILNTTFISLNYDIILDNVLTQIQNTHDLDLDYGIDFTNFEIYGDSWNKPRPEKAVRLYKPHGSLNWLYCPTCITIELTPEIKGAATLIFEPKKCECGTEMIPIIIPPTFFKVMSNKYLQEIWYKIEDVLKQAKEIYFCGYSFPDADIHIKYLLKRAELNRKSNLEIHVINKDKTKDFKLRHKRFLKSNKIYFSVQTFEDFCINGLKK